MLEIFEAVWLYVLTIYTYPIWVVIGVMYALYTALATNGEEEEIDEEAMMDFWAALSEEHATAWYTIVAATCFYALMIQIILYAFNVSY